jgi:hypothetical protein
MTAPVSSDITWDTLHSQVWDLIDPAGQPVDNLPVILGLIGASLLPPAEQREAVLEWARSAAYAPAPRKLKDEVERYLGERP